MLVVQLNGQLEERLKEAARANGAEPERLALQLLDENLPSGNLDVQYQQGYQRLPEDDAEARAMSLSDLPDPGDATLALFEKIEREGSVTDPAEVRRRNEEGEELMRNLARNRLDSEGPHARKL